MSGASLTPCAGLMEKENTQEPDAEAAAAAAAVSSLSLTAESESSEGGKAAALAEVATAGAGDASDSSETTKWVEMPEDHVRWILAQKPEKHPTPSIEDYELYRTHDPVKSDIISQANIDAKRELFSELFVSLRESHDDFFKYQAWIREVYEKNGRVMVPEEVLGPRDDFQADIDAIWEQCGEEYAREHPEEYAREHSESDLDSDQEDEEQHA